MTFIIHGYHPLAEDGGFYLAAIEYKLNPNLFPHYTAFVTEHLRFSLFVPAIVAFIRITRIPFAWAVLFFELFSLWLTFYAARKIIARCFYNPVAQLAGLCLLSGLWTIPVAGTSLLLMDPYLTGRSFSTPFSLLAIAYALDNWPTIEARRHDLPRSSINPLRKSSFFNGALSHYHSSPFLLCTLSLLAAATFHPLMGAYAVAFVTVLRVDRRPHRAIGWATLFTASVVLAVSLQILAPPQFPALSAAEITRSYWFLAQWHWYEIIGLPGPFALFVALFLGIKHHRSACSDNIRTLCRSSVALGLISAIISVCFARQNAASHIVARLQCLRVFLLIYAVLFLLLGAALVQLALRTRPYLRPNRVAIYAIPCGLLCATAIPMFSAQRHAFPASPHLELPVTTSHNPWTRAFLWIRDNTPRDALFALDAKYIAEDGEDAQSFRATALRSSLPDYVKDGGEAANFPTLARIWQPAATAQSRIYSKSDAEREVSLRPLGATWIVLHSTAPTGHPCPYDSGTIKVCRLLP